MNTWLTNQLAEAHVNEMLRAARSQDAGRTPAHSHQSDVARTSLKTSAPAFHFPLNVKALRIRTGGLLIRTGVRLGGAA